MSGTKSTLLIIDCQKDFHPGGSLAIPTANEDAERIAKLIKDHKDDIDRIVATLDSHLKLHIGHPYFWIDGESGKDHPTPFTIISHEDIKNGKWKARTDITINANVAEIDGNIFQETEGVFLGDGSVNIQKYALEYSRRLEERGRFQICIWPEHCLIGTAGHTVVDCVAEAIDDWSATTGNTVEYILKGQNLLTEMYSFMEADVPVSSCTVLNQSLMNSFNNDSSKLIVCGQAMSHCVNYSLRDIVKHWKHENDKISLLTDCSSAVPGFEDAAIKLQNEMKDAGVQLQTSSFVFK